MCTAVRRRFAAGHHDDRGSHGGFFVNSFQLMVPSITFSGCLQIRGLSLLHDPRSLPCACPTHIRSPCITTEPQSRLRRARLRWARPICSAAVARLFRPCREPGRPPGSAETDQISVDGEEGCCYQRAVRIVAPSITTPAVAYFQSATRSLRASAVIIVLRNRPPLRSTRPWNQRLSAESGWCRSHSHAS